MRPRSGRVSPIARGAATTVAVFFLLFLSLSQPHRVHHFFEGLTHSHDEHQVDSEHHDHGNNQTTPVQPDCVFQSVVQNCHPAQVEQVALRLIESHPETFYPQAISWVDLFYFFSSLQRAPPKDTLLS
jgi:hypothetical protein